jgi:hypothetical protein
MSISLLLLRRNRCDDHRNGRRGKPPTPAAAVAIDSGASVGREPQWNRRELWRGFGEARPFSPLCGLVPAPQDVFGPEVSARKSDAAYDDRDQEIVKIHTPILIAVGKSGTYVRRRLNRMMNKEISLIFS